MSNVFSMDPKLPKLTISLKPPFPYFFLWDRKSHIPYRAVR